MHPSTFSRRRFLTLSGAAAAAGLFARYGANACPIPDLLRSAKELAQGINQFGLDLHRRLERDEQGSIFFSPFSIEAALGMTSAGARGATLAEMEKTLHLPVDPHAGFGELIHHLNGTGLEKKRGFELSVANAIWAMKGYPWHKEFFELTQRHYGSGMVEVDFGESEAARKRINDWIAKETKDKIKDLIGPNVISSLTRMVLTNAIYFKGTWQYQFEKKLTRDLPFTREDGTKADVPTMHMEADVGYGVMDFFYRRRDGVKAQVLELPYTGDELSMLIYLPETPDATGRLMQCLTREDLAAPKVKEQRVKIFLPRFKAESKFLLNAPLMDLGMRKAFGDADFTGMSPNGRDLFISHVLHKAFVDVNEEGTEAAAATAVVIAERVSSKPPLPPVFRADRPFVFVIRENRTGTALFMGRYNGPKA